MRNIQWRTMVLIELLCIYGFILVAWLFFCYCCFCLLCIFCLSSGEKKIAGYKLGFLCSAFIIWFVNYVFSGGGLFHPVGAALFWLVVFRFLYL